MIAIIIKVMHQPNPIPAFHLLQNYLWLLHDDSVAWIVDPGDAGPVNETLQKHQYQLEGILLTHHHWDHVNGARDLREKHNAPIYGPANSPFEHIDHPLKNGEHIDIIDRKFEIMTIPGHTLDHIAYYSAATAQSKPWLFCGDVLFAGGCGRVFEGDAKMMWDSLSKLANLPDDTEVYCGHEYTVDNLHFARHIEPNNQVVQKRLELEMSRRADGVPTLPSSIALEKQTNPFLRPADRNLRVAMGYVDNSHVDDVTVFAKLREQKDSYAPPQPSAI